jgi:hypothetical protein
MVVRTWLRPPTSYVKRGTWPINNIRLCRLRYKSGIVCLFVCLFYIYRVPGLKGPCVGRATATYHVPRRAPSIYIKIFISPCSTASLCFPSPAEVPNRVPKRPYSQSKSYNTIQMVDSPTLRLPSQASEGLFPLFVPLSISCKTRMRSYALVNR